MEVFVVLGLLFVLFLNCVGFFVVVCLFSSCCVCLLLLFCV